MYHIGNDKFVSVSVWNGELKVHIRQYYNIANDPNTKWAGKMIPTKKGIALNKYEWENLKTCIDTVSQEMSNIDMADVLAGIMQQKCTEDH